MNTPGLVSSLLLWGAMLVYTHALPHPPRARLQMWLALPAMFFINHIKMAHVHYMMPMILLDIAGYALCTWFIMRTTKLTPSTGLYCAVWVVITTYSAYEVWLLLEWVLDLGAAFTPTQLIFCQIGFTAAFYLLVRFTIVPMLRLTEEGFRTGPRQLGSAVALGILFAVQFQMLMALRGSGESLSSRRVFVILLIQLYCPAILGFQNSMFGFSAMDKELKTITALYERQRSQYEIARSNVQLIYKRCHNLKLQLAAVRQYLPSDFPVQDFSDAERAVSVVERCANTGNEVLDTVLTEKALDCEARCININAVADGKILNFMEAGDLYALFAGMLDELIRIVSALEQADRRQIDVMVFARQGFAVIQIAAAMPATELRPRKEQERSAEYKVIRKIVLCGIVRVLLSVTGPVNGLFHTGINFMTLPEAFRPIYIISGIWQGAGWSSIMYTAALSNASQELKEAAMLDGANLIQQIQTVEWPAIKDMVVIQFILQAGNIMSIGFEKAYALQTDLNLNSAEIIATYVYKKGLLDGDYSFSTAVGLFNTVINVILLIAVNKIVAKMNDGQGL